MKKLTGSIPKSPFNSFNLLSKFRDRKIAFNNTDLSPDFSKIPTSSDIGIARSLLNQPIFMNQLFAHDNSGMLRASISVCEHFFFVADISRSFQHNDINTTKLQNVKVAVDLRGIVKLIERWIKTHLCLAANFMWRNGSPIPPEAIIFARSLDCC